MLKINYEKHEWEKREYVDGKKLYPEEWMIEDDAQILEIYKSHKAGESIHCIREKMLCHT